MRALPILLALTPACSLFKLAALERSFPPIDGTRVEQTAPTSVQIRRDVHGVPHVQADSEAGGWYGLGYVHGQDRLFQADLMRHLAFGRVGSWLGDGVTSFDHFARALRLESRAERAVGRLDADSRAMLEAYAAGINAGAASLKHPPIEYRLLKEEFEPWSVSDSFAVAYLQAWALAGNLSHEMAALALKDLPASTLDALLRSGPEGPAVDAYWDTLRTAQIGDFTPEFLAFTRVLGGDAGAGEASNNWVVGPDLTASGAAIVANDPHLSQSVPSLWYAADVSGGALRVAGATLPGLPGMPIGHSEHVAWGLTNVMADLVDLVILERHGDDGYVLEGERHTLRAIPVHSARTDGTHVPGQVWSTAIGPVITELEGTHLVVLRWAALEHDDNMVTVLRSLATSTNAAEALSSAGLPLPVSQNVVYADTEGSWGWRVVGTMPLRRAHSGRVPYPGSDPAHGWAGWRTDLPASEAPEEGFVVTANSRPDHPDADAISTGYVPDHRYQRIRTLLSELGEGQQPGDQHRIQLDGADGTAARHLSRLLDGVQPESGPGRTCHRLLTEWDQVASADSAGAAVWAVFHREVIRHAIEDDVGADGVRTYFHVGSPGRSLLDSGAFDTFLQDRARSVTFALEQTCRQLTTLLGEDPSTWTWGALHPLRLQHPFGRTRPKLLARWNMPVVPIGGTSAAVASTGYSFSADELLDVGIMPSLRIVMPLSDLGASTFVMPGGQSGHPGHPLYTSHYSHFVNGRTLPLWFDEEDVAANTLWTLTLDPK
ncbi:MAG: penicillin acylase family protein [Myxococcales bacterium]|nr:penicillin acylase family protein [Myxococcales bacterium]